MITMTENELRQQYVNKAITYQGAKESNNSHRPIIDLYNSIRPLPNGYKLSYSDPWCAGFVSAVAKACGLTDIIFPECSCDRQIALFKKAGRWQENDAYKPQMGDIIFYDWNDSGAGDNAGSSDHVGIVVEVNGTTIRVIEGNISDSVGYRNITVNAKFIRGYGLPDYAGKAKGTTSTKVESTTSSTTTATSTSTKVVTPKKCTVQALQLSKGCKGEAVGVLQIILIYKYKQKLEGKNNGIDKEFGSSTEKAVIAAQKAEGLEPDGIVGTQTWKKFLGN